MRKYLHRLLLSFAILFPISSCEEEIKYIEVSGFSPKEGVVGTMITLTGRNFGSANKTYVWFDSFKSGTGTDIVEATSTQLKFRLPDGATTSKIYVQYWHDGFADIDSTATEFVVR